MSLISFKSEIIKIFSKTRRCFLYVFQAEILLIVVIPILTFGLAWFESTPYYEILIGTAGVVTAVNEKLSGLDFNSEGSHSIYRNDNNFHNIFGLIKQHTNGEFLPAEAPYFIAVLPPDTMQRVAVPSGTSSTNYV